MKKNKGEWKVILDGTILLVVLGKEREKKKNEIKAKIMK